MATTGRGRIEPPALPRQPDQQGHHAHQVGRAVGQAQDRDPGRAVGERRAHGEHGHAPTAATPRDDQARGAAVAEGVVRPGPAGGRRCRGTARRPARPGPRARKESPSPVLSAPKATEPHRRAAERERWPPPPAGRQRPCAPAPSAPTCGTGPGRRRAASATSSGRIAVWIGWARIAVGGEEEDPADLVGDHRRPRRPTPATMAPPRSSPGAGCGARRPSPSGRSTSAHPAVAPAASRGRRRKPDARQATSEDADEGDHAAGAGERRGASRSPVREVEAAGRGRPRARNRTRDATITTVLPMGAAAVARNRRLAWSTRGGAPSRRRTAPPGAGRSGAGRSTSSRCSAATVVGPPRSGAGPGPGRRAPRSATDARRARPGPRPSTPPATCSAPSSSPSSSSRTNAGTSTADRAPAASSSKSTLERELADWKALPR